MVAVAAGPPGWTPALIVRNLLAFAGNLLQVYGVLFGAGTCSRS